MVEIRNALAFALAPLFAIAITACESTSSPPADSTRQCPWVLDGGSVGYSGYGTVADLACDVPASCVFPVFVTFSYPSVSCSCLNAPQIYNDCSCVDGGVLCQGMRPTSHCEHCGRDTGTPEESGDALDAGDVVVGDAADAALD
jgi:hypothetical protein